MDLLRHFKTQWIPLRNKETVPGRSFEKSYTKAGPLLGSQCPDLISRATFGAIPATVPFIIQQSCVLMCHWTTRTFQDNNAVFKSLDTMEWFPHVMLSPKQCLNLSMDSRIPSLSRKCIHPHTNSGLKLSMNILTLDEHRLPRQGGP
ncbi:hypothetical protein TNCT_404211 [Trichonephila clavata]|uniref:Uncharacterized protein n=1 Tax=Trichonephila clavata TaxID=2740835 RepID=A0A8X6HBY0_TRICU|nr:hypothetical protein TNCT_404211 [Trichonephila clavata]